MYSFTAERQNIFTVQCECGRRYIMEEMYCCLACQGAFCRNCITTDIYCYYCRHCNENTFPSDMVSIKTYCSSCFECPICKNVLQLMQDSHQNNYFQCQFCFWSLKNLNIQDVKIDQLYQKIQQEQKKLTDPMNHEFTRVQSKLKEIEQEIKSKRQAYKFKKALNRSYTTNISKSEIQRKFQQQEIEERQQEKDKKMEILKNDLELTDNQTPLISTNMGNEFFYQSQFNIQEELRQFENTNFQKSNLNNLVIQLVFNSDQKMKYLGIIQTGSEKLLPNPLTLLTKKNRKCRQCGKMIVKIEKMKENKFIQNFTSFLWFNFKILSQFSEYAPTFQFVKVKMANKEQTDILLQLNIVNKTKTALRVKLAPLNPEFAKKNQLIEIKEFPMVHLELTATEFTEQEKPTQNYFDFLIPLQNDGKIKIGFLVEVQLEQEKSGLKYIQTVNIN